MKILTFTNGKGGVGKTTLAAHTAYVLATEYRNRVALLDLDRQWQATKHLGVESGDAGAAAFVMGGGKNLNDHMVVARPGLWVLPGSEMTQAVDVALGTARKPATYLRNILAYWEKQLDVVVIDTPAHGYLNEMAIVGADLVVVPTPPRHMDTDGVQIFASIWNSASGAAGVTPPPVLVVPNMVDNRTSVTGDLLASLEKSLDDVRSMGWRMSNNIPVNTNFSRAFAEGRTIFELQTKSETRNARMAIRSVVADMAEQLNIAYPEPMAA